MNIIHFAKKLRQVSDLLNELLDTHIGVLAPETPAKARAIKKDLKRRSYNGTHWTQQPKNKARLKKILKDASKKRASKEKR